MGHGDRGVTQKQTYGCYLLKTGLNQVLREHVPVGDTENTITSGKQILLVVELYVNRIKNSIGWIFRFLFWALLCIVPLAESLLANRHFTDSLSDTLAVLGKMLYRQMDTESRQLFDFLYLFIFITICCICQLQILS